jgi:hypothetical protein
VNADAHPVGISCSARPSGASMHRGARASITISNQAGSSRTARQCAARRLAQAAVPRERRSSALPRQGSAAACGRALHRFAAPLPAFLLQAGDPRRPQLPDLHKLVMRRMNGPIVVFGQTIEALGAAWYRPCRPKRGVAQPEANEPGQSRSARRAISPSAAAAVRSADPEQ